MKNSVDSINSPLEMGFSKQSISNSKDIYLLSKQGYMALVQMMRTEKAKEIRKQLRREYFTMRQVNKSNENMKAQLLLAMYNGGAVAITRLILAHIRDFFIHA